MADQHSELSGGPDILRQAYDDPSRCLKVLPKAETDLGTFVSLLAESDGQLRVTDTQSLSALVAAVDLLGDIAGILTPATTAAVTQVGDSASSVQLLAAAPTRLGASFFNDSSAIAYLKCGQTASTASYTVKMAAGGYYELPSPVYTGRIDCIWASDAGGVMAITELTP